MILVEMNFRERVIFLKSCFFKYLVGKRKRKKKSYMKGITGIEKKIF